MVDKEIIRGSSGTGPDIGRTSDDWDLKVSESPGDHVPSDTYRYISFCVSASSVVKERDEEPKEESVLSGVKTGPLESPVPVGERVRRGRESRLETGCVLTSPAPSCLSVLPFVIKVLDRRNKQDFPFSPFPLG